MRAAGPCSLLACKFGIPHSACDRRSRPGNGINSTPRKRSGTWSCMPPLRIPTQNPGTELGWTKGSQSACRVPISLRVAGTERCSWSMTTEWPTISSGIPLDSPDTALWGGELVSQESGLLRWFRRRPFLQDRRQRICWYLRPPASALGAARRNGERTTDLTHLGVAQRPDVALQVPLFNRLDVI